MSKRVFMLHVCGLLLLSACEIVPGNSTSLPQPPDPKSIYIEVYRSDSRVVFNADGSTSLVTHTKDPSAGEFSANFDVASFEGLVDELRRRNFFEKRKVSGSSGDPAVLVGRENRCLPTQNLGADPGQYQEIVALLDSASWKLSWQRLDLSDQISNQGLFGTATVTTGNCMPRACGENEPAPPQSCVRTPFAGAVVNVYSPPIISSGETHPNLPSPITSVTADAKGRFAIELDPGEYSVFIGDYCNGWDKEGRACPMKIDSGVKLYLDLDENHASY